jgi:hypothetical protein
MTGWVPLPGWVVVVLVLVGLVAVLAVVMAVLDWRDRGVLRVPTWRRFDLAFPAAVLATLVLGVVIVLRMLGLANDLPAGKDRVALQADAIKTGVTIAIGTGGAAYLLLAYRRHRMEEVDTRERRITELYTKAVEQLGHDKSAVRLGALYSLERLGQANPEHRQTVTSVLCAYLRMPYTPPPQDDEAESRRAEANAQDREEREVRLTAQHILADHLKPGTSGRATQKRKPSPNYAFWPGMELNLTDATLVDAPFTGISVTHAAFTRATFVGHAGFVGFTGGADFVGAHFAAHAVCTFSFAEFTGPANFTDVVFAGDVHFDHASFAGRADFLGATFAANADFSNATFASDLGVTFTGARVMDPRNPKLSRTWPPGWTIRHNPHVRDWSRLVSMHEADEVREAEPPRRSPRIQRRGP